MNSTIKVVKEQINSFYLIIRLSIYEMKMNNNSNYLGFLWEIINPMIQIVIYWFVFGTIRDGNKVNLENGQKVDFIFWLLSGIVVWFFINPAIIQGSKSIYSRLRLVSKMNFPMSAIPSYVIISQLYQHLILTLIIIIILQFSGLTISLYIIQLPYFMFATLFFLLSVSLIMSTLSTIIRDVQMILQSTMRMMIYLTPFLWTPDFIKEELPIVHKIMILNPLYYITEGYRSSLLGISWYPIDHYQYTLYFWSIIILLFMFGSIIHLKFKDQFVDYL